VVALLQLGEPLLLVAFLLLAAVPVVVRPTHIPERRGLVAEEQPRANPVRELAVAEAAWAGLRLRLHLMMVIFPEKERSVVPVLVVAWMPPATFHKAMELQAYGGLLAEVAAEATRPTTEKVQVAAGMGVRAKVLMGPLEPQILEVEAEVAALALAQAAQAAPASSASGGLNKENRNELRTHQKQRG
jgi:hypothetical protein